MHNYATNHTQITPGSSLSGFGGALLTLLFFVPWFSACNIAMSGKVLAFGIDTGLGISTDGAYPWLALIPIAGLVAVGVALFNINQPMDVVRRRAPVALAAGGVALALLALVGIGFLSALDDSECALTGCSVEFGYFASVVAAGLMLGGGVLDLMQYAWGALTRGAHPPGTRTGYRQAPAPVRAPPVRPGPVVARASLVGQRGEYAGATLAISSDHWHIGRSKDSQLRLSDPQVSRLHAVIRMGGGRFFIQDQNSSSGIRVNGRPTRATALNDGDVIEIGRDVFVFRAR